MKDKLKDPNLYYILVPAVAAIWALLAGLMFYPKSVKAFQEDVKPVYEESQQWMLKLIELQPERLNYTVQKGKTGEFDFGQSVDVLTQLLQIPPGKYVFNGRTPVDRGGKKSQTATMKIKELDIKSIGQFLTNMLAISPDLKCDRVSIEKAKGGKDNWNVDFTFTYVYE